MIYDLTDRAQIQNLRARLNQLAQDGKTIEINVQSEIRSIDQNSYLHLLLGYFASEYGESLQYVKTEIFKKIVNPYIFKVDSKNTSEGIKKMRSSADLTSAEMSEAITRFKEYASKEAGLYLPDAHNKTELSRVRAIVKNQKRYI